MQHAYPNPFNSFVSIDYQLTHDGISSLKVFDLSGREVANLIDGEFNAGYRQIAWNAESAPSGLYFAKIDAGQSTRTVKLLLSR